jgi:hypothetical protein
MAINFLRIDKGIRFVPQSSPPTSPQEGDAYYDSTTNSFRVYDGSSWITVEGDDVKTASNVGTGSQVFKQKTNSDLEFRSLVAGTNINITQGANDITISSTGGGGGEANTASNVGTGSQVFKQKTGVDLEFRTLVAGTNINITQGANDITISSTGGGGGATVVTPASYPHSAANNTIILVNTSAPRTINLPAPSASANITIKDATGQAATNNITIARSGSEQIEGVGANYLIQGDWASIRLVSDGTNWFIV